MFTSLIKQEAPEVQTTERERQVGQMPLQLIEYLARQISRPENARSVLTSVDRFRAMSREEQLAKLTPTYLLLEQYLVELDPCKKFLKEQLREIVKTRFEPLLHRSAEFDLVFQQPSSQEVLLCRRFTARAFQEAIPVCWGKLRAEVKETLAWHSGGSRSALPPILDGILAGVPRNDRGWVELYRTLSRTLEIRLERSAGTRSVAGVYERAYEELADTFIGLETFSAVMDLLPVSMIDREKSALLYLGKIRRAVSERTDQLHEINEQLLAKNKELAAMRAELNRIKDQLELRVRERTSELEEANERLRSEIRERQQAEMALKLSEEYAHNIIDSSLDMIIAVNRDRNIVEFNKAAQEAFGYTRDEIIGKDVGVLYATPDDSLLVHQRTVDQGGEVREIVNKRKNGDLFPSLLSASLLKDASGEIIGYMGISRDRTKEKQAEENLRASEEKYRALFEESRDVVFITTPQGNLLDINPAGIELFGYSSKSEILEINMFQGIVLDSHEQEQFHNALRRDGFVKDLHLTLVRKDGKRCTTAVTANVVRDHEGKLVAYRGIMRDISERQQLEQQLLQSQKLESIGLLAGGIAHDINNVLTPIIVGIEYLRTKEPDAENQKMLDMIGTSAKRGAEIVKQILTIGRRVTGERTEIQLKHHIKEIAKIALETFPKSIKILAECPPDLWVVSGDATQLHQVLLNLCVNARDAMPQGGTLTVSGKNALLDEHYARMHVDAKPGPYVVLQVTDSGTGIPQEIMHKIFEPFYTTKAPGKGTGLGLSTVHAIVKSHSGFINVYSEPNKGTRFSVYVPAQRTEAVRENEKVLTQLKKGNGELILIVDDESTVLEVTKATLEKYGYNTLTASDGTQALALFAKNRSSIKAVITDMSMPIMDGAKTIRALRRIDSGLRIIAASGRNGHRKEADASGIQIDAFLEKPYTGDVLVGLLQEVLSR